VTSGRSNRHVGSVADRVLEDLAAAGLPARVEGMPHCDWVLIDAGDVLVHVFRPEVRGFYNLEKMGAPARPHGRRASSRPLTKFVTGRASGVRGQTLRAYRHACASSSPPSAG